MIYEKSSPGRRAYKPISMDVPNQSGLLPEALLRKTAPILPELSEPDVVRHYTNISNMNHGVDSGFYPLGSCTMKYNPKINENIAALPGFVNTHPLAGGENMQGSLKIIYELSQMLCEITGMDAFSTNPSAGAHGELAGLYIIKAYHINNKDYGRTKILVPDTAHGTNPASAAMAGFETVTVNSGPDGTVDMDDLASKMDKATAGLMFTNPSTLGLFEYNIEKIEQIVHGHGGLMYCDGANLNAIMGITRPGDMGFDIMHLNLHKTFASPHGGGGAGSGPVGVKRHLKGFLPVPEIIYENGNYTVNCKAPLTIGKIRSFYGNFSVFARVYAYILLMGPEGLRHVSENAVLNANYLRKKLSNVIDIAYDKICMHEFVATAENLKAYGVSALDIAKRMLDFGVHPPTMYFPLIVKEALMIEPTETESKEVLDAFAEIMETIIGEAKSNPGILKGAPHNTRVGRLDDVGAARNPILKATTKSPPV